MNKKSQISETMTWIIATIAILVMTFVFVFAVSVISTTEKVPESLSSVGSVLSRLAGSGDSGVEVQQMLFGILNKDSEKIKKLIQNEKYDDVEKSVTGILSEFSKSGVNCNFYIYELGVIYDTEHVKIENGGSGREAKLYFNKNQVVLLKC